jgi:hypothetical protein
VMGYISLPKVKVVGRVHTDSYSVCVCIYIHTLRVNYKSQLCLRLVDLFHAFEITYKAEEKMKFARRVNQGGINFLQFHAV